MKKNIATWFAVIVMVVLSFVVAFSGIASVPVEALKETSLTTTVTAKKATKSKKKAKSETTTKAKSATKKNKKKKNKQTATTTAATTEAPKYTDWELEMMAIVIYREAGGDAASNKTRIMVGNVVMNRVRSKHFPNTIYGVLTQRGQYAGMSGAVTWPSRASNRYEQNAVKRAWACAKRVLEGENYLPANVVYQSDYRTLGSGIYCVSDGMYFNYE